MPRYAEAGVQHAWLVDPRARTLEVYSATSGRWHLVARHEGEGLVRAEPFEALEVDLGDLWVG
jgi:Uma2 family endonuclease